jgi:hypothetical protein
MVTLFQMSTQNLNHAALIQAAGHAVEVKRQACGVRCVFVFNDTPEIRGLLDRYERGESLDIPPKLIFRARAALRLECDRAVRGVL